VPGRPLPAFCLRSGAIHCALLSEASKRIINAGKGSMMKLAGGGGIATSGLIEACSLTCIGHTLAHCMSHIITVIKFLVLPSSSVLDMLLGPSRLGLCIKAKGDGGFLSHHIWLTVPLSCLQARSHW